MLPFTKRPGRGDESGDNEVVTKDDIVPAELSKPGATSGGRAKFSSLSDDEMTNIMPARSIGDALTEARASSPRPAAGAPPPSRSVPPARVSAPPSRASSASLAGSSSRSGKFAALEDEEDDGRTVVRGAPKIVKRSSAPNKMGMPTMPTTVSPAAVIKATLESARGQRKTGDLQNLMAPPPAHLLEDLSDFDADGPPAEQTAILQQSVGSGSMPPPMVQGVKALSSQRLQPQAVPVATGSSRSLSGPPSAPHSHPSMARQSAGYAQQSGGYAQQSGGYAQQSGSYAPPSSGRAQQSGGYAAQYSGALPSATASVPGVSMPAHFMVPQAPYSDGRVDPPGTAITARTRIGGRPAKSWAVALGAFTLFVGLGAFAVLRGNAEGLTETSAAFVDPSRAAAASKAAMVGEQAAVSTPVPVVNEPPAKVEVPPVAVPVAAADPAAAPVVTTPAAPAKAAAPAAPPPVVVAAAPAPAPKPVVVAQPAPAPRPVAPAPRPVAAKPAEEPVAAAPKPAAGKPRPAGKGNAEVDEETKKALEALQKSQLESSF